MYKIEFTKSNQEGTETIKLVKIKFEDAVKMVMESKITHGPSCVLILKAKEFLKQNKIKFEDKDVSADDKARNEMIKKTGQMGVPVIDINGEIIIGFDVERIKEALKL